jgi:hypothetical protein
MCKECSSEYQSTHRKKIIKLRGKYSNKPVDINYLFKYRHGFERKEALEILKAQGGCDICKVVLPEEGGHWYVDHNHECCPNGKSCGNCRRGILCRECNLMLGFAKDNPQILSKAIEYLARYE